MVELFKTFIDIHTIQTELIADLFIDINDILLPAPNFHPNLNGG